MTTSIPRKNSFEGFGLGMLGILCFSFTLPATRLAVAWFDPMIVGLGRAVVAGLIAVPVLLITRQPWPTKSQWKGLGVVAAGIVVGFSILTAWAMQKVPASHGAVVLGILPMVTAVVATLRSRERPPARFWIFSAMGSAIVISYALGQGNVAFHSADLALLAAVLLGALGYAEGGRLAREMGGWQVINWALALSLPFVMAPVASAFWKHGLHGPASAWFGFIYVCLFSMYLSFFAWYRALAIGGITRVSQIQLLQPFITLMWSALFLGEKLGLGALICALLVALTIYLGKRR